MKQKPIKIWIAGNLKIGYKNQIKMFTLTENSTLNSQIVNNMNIDSQMHFVQSSYCRKQLLIAVLASHQNNIKEKSIKIVVGFNIQARTHNMHNQTSNNSYALHNRIGID